MDNDTIMLEVDGKAHAFALSVAIRTRIEDLRLNPDATIFDSDVPVEVNASAEIYVLNELGALLSERINEKADISQIKFRFSLR